MIEGLEFDINNYKSCLTNADLVLINNKLNELIRLVNNLSLAVYGVKEGDLEQISGKLSEIKEFNGD